MGGSGSPRVKLLFESARTKLREMEGAYSRDPTPGLEKRIDARRKLLIKLDAEHQRFGRLMEVGDDELKVENSNERNEKMKRVFGDPELVKKLFSRKFTEAEYHELTEGDDVIKKRF